jgi:hypothetical protein
VISAAENSNKFPQKPGFGRGKTQLEMAQIRPFFTF